MRVRGGSSFSPCLATCTTTQFQPQPAAREATMGQLSFLLFLCSPTVFPAVTGTGSEEHWTAGTGWPAAATARSDIGCMDGPQPAGKYGAYRPSQRHLNRPTGTAARNVGSSPILQNPKLLSTELCPAFPIYCSVQPTPLIQLLLLGRPAYRYRPHVHPSLLKRRLRSVPG